MKGDLYVMSNTTFLVNRRHKAIYKPSIICLFLTGIFRDCDGRT